MVKKEVTVTMSAGLDARGVALLVQNASSYASQIQITDGKRTMNAKSLMGMIAMRISDGQHLEVIANGPDEAEACTAVVNFLKG